MVHGAHRPSSSIIRAAWLMIALGGTVGWIAGPVSQWHALQTVCHPDAACLRFQVDAAGVAALRHHGVSLTAYAVFIAILLAAVWVAWYGVASLIVLRQSHDRGALIAAFFLVLLPVWGELQWLPSSDVASEISNAFISGLLLFCLLFPDGHFTPPWTRWLAALIVLLFIVGGFPLPGILSVALTVAALATLAAVIGAQVHRYRSHSTWAQRQQTKWAIFGLAVAISGLASSWILQDVAPFPTGNGSLYMSFTTMVATAAVLSAIPLSIGVAVLRNRLWDIDRVVNRALVYGSLTGMLVVIYAGSVIGLQALSRLIMGSSSSLVIALSTLAIAALSGPLRNWIQRGIDRRFYRSKYDAQETLTAFGERLRNEVDLGQLSQDLTLIVRDTLHPEHASLWLRQ